MYMCTVYTGEMVYVHVHGIVGDKKIKKWLQHTSLYKYIFNVIGYAGWQLAECLDQERGQV